MSTELQIRTGTPFGRAELLNLGYREYPPCFPQQGAHALFQKCVTNGAGRKRYFININEYRFPDGRVGWQLDGQFSADGKTFDVTLHPCGSVEEAEAFFERLFTAMGCDDYDNT